MDTEILICLAHGADVNLSDSAKLVPRLELKAEQMRANGLLREQFVKTRGVLRTLLAIQTGMAPEALEISRDEAKPYLLNVESIHFNVSRSADIIAVAIGSVPLGVDIEVVDGAANNEDVIDTLFHCNEKQHIDAFSGAARTSAFYEVWTRKEAFAKAVGLGMALDFAGFSVVPEEGEVQVDAPSVSDETWHARSVEAKPECRLAVASPLKNPLVKVVDWPLAS